PEPALLRALHQLDEGESWLIEPRQLDDEGLLWRPGVKIGVRTRTWSHLNDCFGPVLAIMVANDLDECIRWQNATPYGLTAGLHSLNERECEHWLNHVEAGNLYLNRGITGAVVARQPFGGWKRSSVGPTAKAGGAHYVECLRRWPRVSDHESALKDASMWWREVGSTAHDDAALAGERNLVRYRRHSSPIVVRIDDSFSPTELKYLQGLVDLAGLKIELSTEQLRRGIFDVTLESTDELVERSSGHSLVRWLSRETAPSLALMDRGVRVDIRPLAQVGSVELPRWLLEQSVAITNHRYGNVHAGAKPTCEGLEHLAHPR
ncbi:MAG: aldehyde dehydrogenase family protein, partial [Acidimicrobiales bacterium]